MELVESKTKGRGRKTWNECVKVDMKRQGSVKDDAYNRDKRKSLETVQHCFSVVMRVWFFMNCVLLTLNVSTSSSSIKFSGG